MDVKLLFMLELCDGNILYTFDLVTLIMGFPVWIINAMLLYIQPFPNILTTIQIPPFPLKLLFIAQEKVVPLSFSFRA